MYYIYLLYYIKYILYYISIDFTLAMQYLFRAVCSRSWDLRVIVGQGKTRTHAICWTFHSDCIWFNALVCTWSRYENTIVRKDFLPTGYWIGRCCFLITFFSSAEGRRNVIDIGCWNLINLFFSPQNL